MGKRESNRLNTYNAIMAAGRAALIEYGYKRVTVRDIIRRTNLASGTFYNYFPDQQSLDS